MIRLTMTVADISATIAVFSHIRLYYSTDTDSDGTYTQLTDITLVGGTSVYYYEHNAGETNMWYKTSYWSVSLESSLSEAVQGEYGQLYHYPIFPKEITLADPDIKIVRRIRRYIGDDKGLSRVYESTSAEPCTAIAEDGVTVDMGENGWPVYIALTTSSGVVTEKTDLNDPYVQGYQHLTFSTTLPAANTLDVWFYTFKYSDREIYEAYGDSMIPAGLTADTVTVDHLVLQASIDLLSSMANEDMVDDGAVIKDDQSTYDPSPGLKERDKAIQRLKDLLDDLVKQYKFSNLTGVLID